MNRTPPTFYIDDQGTPYDPHAQGVISDHSVVSFADTETPSMERRLLELVGGKSDAPAQFRAIKVLWEGDYLDHDNIHRTITDIDLLRASKAPMRLLPVLAHTHNSGDPIGAVFGFVKFWRSLFALIVMRQEVAVQVGLGKEFEWAAVTFESKADPTRQSGVSSQISAVVLTRKTPPNDQSSMPIQIASPAERARANLNTKDMRSHATISIGMDLDANMVDFSTSAPVIYNKLTEYGIE